MDLPQRVRLTEVGPRDGLQNEPKAITTETKLALIKQLTASGLTDIEATSFVSPRWVPQMADHRQVVEALKTWPNTETHYPVLVPNLTGMQAAIEAGAKTVAVFTACSERFSKKNTNCSIKEGMARISDIIALAQAHDIPVRGYISCVLGCPYEGHTSLTTTVDLSQQLLEKGCYEVSLGDTIGIGTPGKTTALLQAILSSCPKNQIAMHFHDTYGQALANIYASLLLGITHFDSAVAGLGGCPYAPGASGNVATEDVLYMLEGLDIETGVDLKRVVQAGYFISNAIGRPTRSKVANAMRHHLAG